MTTRLANVRERSLNSLLVLLLTTILYYNVKFCRAQLPAVCTNPVNFYNQICCPEPFVGAGPCGSKLLIPRGRCIKIAVNETTTDIRGNWPHYYDKICECEPQFGNFDCGECASGFIGVNCDEKIVRTRKLINHLSSDELNYLISTLYMAKSYPSRYVIVTNETKPATVPPMKVASVYNVFVWVHYYISKETYTYDFGHGGPGFPIWHRQYLMWFEREIQWMLGNDSNFAFPFWDWSSENNRMYPFQEHILGASDEKGNLIGNFANWTTVCSDSVSTGNICDLSQTKEHLTRFRTSELYAAKYTRWPRREEVCKAISIAVYDGPPYDTGVEEHKGFRNFMEGFYVGNETCNSSLFDCTSHTNRLQLHNQVHNMLNGTFTDVPTASNDPLFILHHAFVDYILEMWIRRYHGEFKPSPEDTSAAKGHNYNDLIVPFLPLVRAHEMLVESTTLGFTYESLNGLDIDSPDCELNGTYHNDSIVIESDLPMASEEMFSHHKNHGKSLPANNFKVPLTYHQYYYQQQQLNPGYHVCIIPAGEVSFQIPPNCDQVLFQRNLILPKILLPFSWYYCSLQRLLSARSLLKTPDINQYYFCTKV